MKDKSQPFMAFGTDGSILLANRRPERRHSFEMTRLSAAESTMLRRRLEDALEEVMSRLIARRSRKLRLR